MQSAYSLDDISGQPRLQYNCVLHVCIVQHLHKDGQHIEEWGGSWNTELSNLIFLLILYFTTLSRLKLSQLLDFISLSHLFLPLKISIKYLNKAIIKQTVSLAFVFVWLTHLAVSDRQLSNQQSSPGLCIP